MLTRLQLERGQILFYLAAISLGAALGWYMPAVAPLLERLLWPVVAALLYVTFAQVPLLEVRGMLGHGRFLAALLVALCAAFLPQGYLIGLLLGLVLVHAGGWKKPESLA